MQKTLTLGAMTGIVDTLGGEMISCCKNGKEILWCGDPAHWSGHAPVLFPFVSALKDDSIKFGRHTGTYKGKHGFARKSEFEISELTESSVTFVLKENKKTLEFFPYAFELYVTHTLTENGFTTSYRVVNTGKKGFPFCIGGHPGFALDCELEGYKLVFPEEEMAELYYTDEKSLFDESYFAGAAIKGKEFFPTNWDFNRDALIAKDLKSRSVSLVKKDTGTGIRFDFADFPVLVLWTPPQKHSPFFCLEPWRGLPAYTNESGKFEDKPFAKTLAAGEEDKVSYTVTVID